MKWVKTVFNVLNKVKHVVRFALAIEAAIDAFQKVLEKDKKLIADVENEEK